MLQKKNIKVEPFVFFPAAALIIFFVILGIFFTGPFAALADATFRFVTDVFGWFLILSVSGWLFFVIWLMSSRYGNIKLGPDDSEPSYSFISWACMLFSAGLGIGLLFFGVAEPLLHYANPPRGDAESINAVRTAIATTFFHWGVHAWAIYSVVGLSVAYFGFRKNLPITLRSTLYPILGKKIYSWPGHLIDLIAILGTLFGVATSLGLGAMQVNAGLDYLLGIPQSTGFQIVIIIMITLCATVSVVLGLDKGIKRLSEINIGMASLLLIALIIIGPTIFIFKTFIQNFGYYMQNIVQTMFWTEAFSDRDWQGAWTIFYWSWWISWAPFVGIFVARISRGRTIREFTLAVLIVPTLLTFFWMNAFGMSAIDLQRNGNDLLSSVEANVPTALFEFLGYFPMFGLMSTLAVVVIITFFVTSSDSGSFVIDMISSGGDPNPPVWQRIFWSCLEGGVAIVLLIGQGLKALQSATITTALPFALIMIAMCFSLVKSLRSETLHHLHWSNREESETEANES